MTPFSAKKTLARLALDSVGWEAVGEAPPAKKYVLIAAPHTSNWDLVLMLFASTVYGIWPSWVGKHTLFAPPLGPLMRALNGIPVDRRSAQNLVTKLAALFAEREELVLAVPPEGTRGRAPYWKSGFYQIALAANVPICLGYLDFATKRAGLGPLVHPTGDVRADMAVIRAFYADKHGLYPEDQGPVRLRGEDEPDVAER